MVGKSLTNKQPLIVGGGKREVKEEVEALARASCEDACRHGLRRSAH